MVRFFEMSVNKLASRECWAMTAGRGSGSRFTLDIGAKIKRSIPVQNPHLSPDSQQFTGEFALFVENCAWRLEHNKAILCTSKSANSEGGEMLTNLRLLIGRKIENINLIIPGFDLIVKFENGFMLRTFSDCSLEKLMTATIATLFTPTETITVTAQRLRIMAKAAR